MGSQILRDWRRNALLHLRHLAHHTTATVDYCGTSEGDIAEGVPNESQKLDDQEQDYQTNLEALLSRFGELEVAISTEIMMC